MFILYNVMRSNELLRENMYNLNNDFNSSHRAADVRQRGEKIVADVSSGAPTTLVIPGHR